jgi:hypothetical protein
MKFITATLCLLVPLAIGSPDLALGAEPTHDVDVSFTVEAPPLDVGVADFVSFDVVAAVELVMVAPQDAAMTKRQLVSANDRLKELYSSRLAEPWSKSTPGTAVHDSLRERGLVDDEGNRLHGDDGEPIPNEGRVATQGGDRCRSSTVTCSRPAPSTTPTSGPAATRSTPAGESS